MSWTLYWVLLAIGIVMTGIFLFLRVKKDGSSALYAKAAANFCFISTAFAATSANRDNIEFGLWVAFGLILGMVGNIWLDLKWIYLQDKDSYLYSGFISFLLGHICFNVAIYKSYRFTGKTLAVSIGVSLLIAIGNILTEKLMKNHFGKFKFIVFLYTFFLALTMVSAIIAAIATGFEKVWVVMAVGGVLFTLSDAVLSGMYVAEDQITKSATFSKPYLIVYAAQFTMAATITLHKIKNRWELKYSSHRFLRDCL